MRDLDPLSRFLGSVENQLNVITKTLAEDRMASAAYRTDVRTVLDKLQETVAETAGQVRDHGRDIGNMRESIKTEIMPKISAMKQWQDNVEGAAKFAGVMGKLAHVLSVMLGGILVWLMEHVSLGGGPPRPH